MDAGTLKSPGFLEVVNPFSALLGCLARCYRGDEFFGPRRTNAIKKRESGKSQYANLQETFLILKEWEEPDTGSRLVRQKRRLRSRFIPRQTKRRSGSTSRSPHCRATKGSTSDESQPAISAKIGGQGADPAATRPARYESVKVKSGLGGADKDCTESGTARICDFGMLPPGEQREATVNIRLPLGLRPGELVLSATAKIEGEERGTDLKTVRLVPNARAQTNVDLKLTIEPSLEIVGPGSGFFHVIKVVNRSDRHEATNLKLQILHRMVVGNWGGYQYDDGFRTKLPATAARCTTTKNDAKKEIEHRCELEKIAPQGEARVPIEIAALRELPAGKWGQMQTKARVRSAENDPIKGDNKALKDTLVIPRLPEVAILSRVPLQSRLVACRAAYLSE